MRPGNGVAPLLRTTLHAAAPAAARVRLEPRADLRRALPARSITVLAANNVEVTSTDLRTNAAFDNVKATWGKALSVGDLKTQLDVEYDYKGNKDFLSEATLTGNLVDDADMKIDYEVSREFGTKNTNIKLTADTSGTNLGAEYDTDSQLKELTAARNIDVGDRKVNVDAAWLVKSKSARVKLMTALGSGAGDRAKVEIDYPTEGGDTTYEVSLERDLEDGKEMTATFNPQNKNLDIEYVDAKFESGATWTAKASVPLESKNNILDDSKVTLKRAWTW